MNEWMNERLVNHSNRKFKAACYDSERNRERDARLYCIVCYQEHTMCDHLTFFCRELWEKVNHPDSRVRRKEERTRNWRECDYVSVNIFEP
ncbi:hypothetical protein PUN28_018635 [Cardiocondyla obscurior]|uniref:Reverse transcriptase zinc-binding domain-containing protein n=1 Tax=Cardiocondyla obscurior TaxID=286306 RepID=A0AAW2EJ99_9HYME